MNSFFQRIADAGDHHSEGEFTVSLDRALDKLEKYQLKDPNLFILNLVSTAVLLKATFFKVQFLSSHVAIDFDGDRLSLDQLRDLWISPEPVLKELSVALSAARALDYQEIRFVSNGGIRWSAGDKPEFFDTTMTNNFVILVYRQSMVQKLLDNLQGAPPPKPIWVSALRRSCQYAPLSIFAEHHATTKKSLSVHIPAWYSRQVGLNLPRFISVGETSSSMTEMPVNGDFSAIVGSSNNSWAKEWSLVFRGITYTRSIRTLDVAGLGGIVYSDSLAKDISHSDLVENSAFDRLVESLQETTVAYIRDTLSLKPLPPAQIKAWAKAGLWVGERLHLAGDSRNAARVEAWAYGHLFQAPNSYPKPSLDPTSRYRQPLVFLLDYLHWSGRKKLDEKIGLFSPDATLAPWLKGADKTSLSVLLDFLLPLFPEEIGWPMIQPVIEQLSIIDEEAGVLLRLEKRFADIKPENVIPALESILRVASFLHQKGRLDMPAWLSRSFTSGFLPCTIRIVEILAGYEIEDEARRVVKESLGNKKTTALIQAAVEFRTYLRDPGFTSLVSIQNHLTHALKNTPEPSERVELEGLVGILRGDLEAPSSTEFGWETHRAALLYAVLDRKEVSRELHRKAHTRLEQHWFSHLLLGDASLACSETAAAHQHYLRALELAPNALAAKEAVIETSPEEMRQELWIAHARSLATNRIEDVLAFREALALCPSREDFATWVKVRALTSFAEHQAAEALPRVDENVFFGPEAVRLYFLHPAVTRYLLRGMRGRWSKAGSELARLRLTDQLSRSISAFLTWKEEFRDNEETKL